MRVTRRELLRTGWRFGGLALAAAAVWTTYESLRPLASRGTGAKLALGPPGDFAAGSATYLSDGRLWVVNTGTELFALSQKCPHLGCRVPFCASSGRFECPCHGSIYDLGGEYITGPAPRGMDRFKLTLEGGVVFADTATLVTGPPRGTKRFLAPARGPSCIKEGL